MQHRVVAAAIGLLTVLSAESALAQKEGGADGDSVFVTARGADLKWKPITPPGFKKGTEIAVVRGDPAAEDQPYVIRLRFPNGYRFPAHWHPVDENLTVLQGTFLLAMGEHANGSQLHRYHPGDYLFIEARHPHFGGASGETVIQLHGSGPFKIIVVGSPEDQERQQAAGTR
jgi:quercetin dioxygenase-like cupin family protein